MYMPSGLLTHYLVYLVYTPGRHGITNTFILGFCDNFLIDFLVGSGKICAKVTSLQSDS